MKGMNNFMQSNEAVEIMSRAKCECGADATTAVAFRAAPRILCDACYQKKAMRFRVEEEFLVSALEVIARTHGLKSTTMDALREMVIART
jgi:hypothetical protein